MARLTSSHDPRGGRGRWHGVSRRRAVRASQPQSKRHESILSNETLETQVQNDMSPFPAVYREHVSWRRGPCTQASGIATLRSICMWVAVQHFSSHILPTPQALEALSGVRYTEALWWSDVNKDLLKHMPATMMEELFDLLCLHAPWSLTKEILTMYFLPAVGTSSQPPRTRSRLFLPGSLPLFSQDAKCASLILATLAGSFALASDAHVVTRCITALDLHGLTRLPGAAVTRLLRAPSQASHAWRLRRVSLPGCLSVNDATVATIVQVTGDTLEHLDVTLTSVTASSIAAMGAACPRLQVLKLAWCEHLSDASVSQAVSDAISHGAMSRPPMIPFRALHTLDMSHTLVGDIGVSGLLRLCGTQLVSLDVSYTSVAESGTLDVLAMGLGSGTERVSRLEHLGIAGLCVHAVSLLDFVHKWLAYPGEVRQEAPSLRSLCLDNMVEYVRRQPSSLQGRQGLSGDTMLMVAAMMHHTCHQHHVVMDCLSMNGDKRRAYVPSHWALPPDRMTRAWEASGVSMVRMLATCTRRLSLQGLDLSLADAVGHAPSSSVLTELCLQHTSLSDASLQCLIPSTGALTSVFLDNTQVTPTSVDALVAANPQLSILGLSQCRGIPVRDRRAYWDRR